MQLPLPTSLHSAESRSLFAWNVLRILLALFIAAHGWARFVAGGVIPFGGWLDSQGIPFGLPIAVAITAIEVVGSLLLLMRRWVLPLTIIYSLIYIAGIVLVHAPAGWFVVGLGRNGAEYSVLLVTCLLCVGLQHVKPSNTR